MAANWLSGTLSFAGGGFVPASVKFGQVLLILAAGLALTPQNSRRWTALPASVCLSFPIGLFAAVNLPLSSVVATILFGLSLITASVGTIRQNLPIRAVQLAGVVIGAALGAASSPVMPDWPQAGLLIAANWIGIAFSMGALAYIAISLRRDEAPLWMRIGPRIACAWIVAIAVTMLALNFVGTEK